MKRPVAGSQIWGAMLQYQPCLKNENSHIRVTRTAPYKLLLRADVLQVVINLNADKLHLNNNDKDFFIEKISMVHSFLWLMLNTALTLFLY